MQLSATTARLGKYELVERLGHGGMAEVWRARVGGAAGFEKEVAVKLLHPAAGDDGQVVNMFINEARLSARLDHPNIVPTLDFGFAGGRYFIAMELIDGVTLRALPRMDGALAVYLVAELAAALEYAYDAPGADGAPLRVVHRDVNPANVMISTYGQVKLGDFGIARAVGHAVGTEVGALKGKFQYMSPEQAWGRPLDGRSDLYALGLILFELLLGRRAIEGESEIELLNRARDGASLPPGAAIDPALAAILGRALAHDPPGRPAGAGELRRDLQGWLASAPRCDYRAALQHLVAEVERTPAPGAPPAGAAQLDPPTPSLAMSNATLPDTPVGRTGRRAAPVLAAVAAAIAIGGGAWVQRARSHPAPPAAAVNRAAIPAAAPPPAEAPNPRPPLAATTPVSRARATPEHHAARAAEGAATLRIQVAPWGRVWLDDRALGMTPLHPEQVAPGTHVVRAEHPALGVRRRTIKLAPGEARLVHLDFADAAQ